MPIDSTLTLHERMLQDVVLQVQGLGLVGLAHPGNDVGANVVAQKFPTTDNLLYPVVVCVPGEEAESEEDSNFEQDGVAYPVGIFVLDRDSPLDEAPEARPDYLGWRRLIARRFRQLWQLPDVPELFDLSVKPLRPLEQAHPFFTVLRSGLVVWGRTTEFRSKDQA